MIFEDCFPDSTDDCQNVTIVHHSMNVQATDKVKFARSGCGLPHPHCHFSSCSQAHTLFPIWGIHTSRGMKKRKEQEDEDRQTGERLLPPAPTSREVYRWNLLGVFE
jgi:hypothetical protein